MSDGLEVDSPEQTEEKNTSDAAALYGDKFSWQLIGKEENGFASMEIDIRAQQFIFTAYPIAPHSDFATEYAAVTIYNTRGTVVYRQSIKVRCSLAAILTSAGWMRIIRLRSFMPRAQTSRLSATRSMAKAGRSRNT